MNITQTIEIDLGLPRPPRTIHVVAGDSETRFVSVELWAHGAEWIVPDGVTASLAYQKQNGTGGWYDTLPDGEAACAIDGNIVTVELAPQVMAVPGIVQAALVLRGTDGEQLSTFEFYIDVKSSPAGAEPNGDYYRLRGVVHSVNGKTPDANGNVEITIPDSSTNVYIGPDEPTGDNRPLYWLDTSGDSAGEDAVAYTVAANLTNVTIDNPTESVTEDESYAATITAADGYVLSAVSVTMNGVDITGTNYADGNIFITSVTGDIIITATAVEASATTYSITNNLVNASSDNPAVSVEENTSYTATLTAADGCYLSSVSVTMGGTDITADVYADDTITIPAVTGDVVITAIGRAIPTVEEITPDYLRLSDCRIINVLDVDAMATEMPDVISFVSKNIQADYWESGHNFLLRTRTTGWTCTNFYVTVAINNLTVDGIKYGVITIAKTDYMSAYEQRSASIENDGLIGVTSESWLMGNVAARFDASYVVKAVNGNVDESVIAYLNQNWVEVTE